MGIVLDTWNGQHKWRKWITTSKIVYLDNDKSNRIVQTDGDNPHLVGTNGDNPHLVGTNGDNSHLVGTNGDNPHLVGMSKLMGIIHI